MTLRRTLLALPAIAALALSASAQAQGQGQVRSNDPSFRLNNRGNSPIREVYVSATNVNNWGQDRLGQNVLPPGQSLTIRLPRGQCMNDIRIVWQNGQASERRNINTCQFTDLNVPN